MASAGRVKGFTLLELLVVIAIIGILAALLFPVLAVARRRAHQVSCLSNVKQIGAAVLMYTQDYDERYPGGKNVFALWVPGPEGDWEHLLTECCGNVVNSSVAVKLLPYVKAPQVFYCPSDPDGDRIWGGGRKRRLARWPYMWQEGLSLGYSHPTLPIGQATVTEQPLFIGEVSKPALLPLVHCYSYAGDHMGVSWAELQRLVTEGVPMWYNTCYADGHAKYTRFVREGAVSPSGWNWYNPRQPVSVEKPCEPTCAEEAARG